MPGARPWSICSHHRWTVKAPFLCRQLFGHLRSLRWAICGMSKWWENVREQPQRGWERRTARAGSPLAFCPAQLPFAWMPGWACNSCIKASSPAPVYWWLVSSALVQGWKIRDPSLSRCHPSLVVTSSMFCCCHYEMSGSKLLVQIKDNYYHFIVTCI